MRFFGRRWRRDVRGKNQFPAWSEQEIIQLRDFYANAASGELNLDAICGAMNRSRSSVAMKAHRLGIALINRKGGERASIATRKNNEIRTGTTYAAIDLYIASHYQDESAESMARALGISNTCIDNRRKKLGLPIFKGTQKWYQQQCQRSAPVHRGTTWKAGKRPDLGDIHFRSAWEANYARYLNFLISKGEIFKWEFEPDTFWFEKIRRGVRSYKPDFKVWEKHDSQPYYVEIKGWFDDKSKVKLKRMVKYYPGIRVVLFDTKQYRALAKWKAIIPNWESGRY